MMITLIARIKKMRIRKMKPMSIKRINLLLQDISDYQLEKLENGEIVMTKTKKETEQEAEL